MAPSMESTRGQRHAYMACNEVNAACNEATPTPGAEKPPRLVMQTQVAGAAHEKRSSIAGVNNRNEKLRGQKPKTKVAR